jgi:hypothetical protein
MLSLYYSQIISKNFHGVLLDNAVVDKALFALDADTNLFNISIVSNDFFYLKESVRFNSVDHLRS